MNNNKGFIFLIAVIGLIIVALILYYVLTNDSYEISVVNNTSNSVTNNTTKNLDATKVNKYDTFFTVNSLINDFYSKIDDANKALSILDTDYLDVNNITSENLNKFLPSDFTDISYVSTDMYVIKNRSIEYYFVEGDEQVYKSFEDSLVNNSGKKYLVIVDHDSGTYSVTPLNITSLYDYANTYTVYDSYAVKKNSYNAYFSTTLTDQEIGAFYLNYYKNILYLDSEKAFNMLSTSYKNTYKDIDAFVDNIDKLYNGLTSTFLSYSVNGEDTKRTYNINCSTNTRVTFTESAIMKFTVSIS